MKNKKYYIIAIILLSILFVGCGSKSISSKLLNKDLDKVSETNYSDVENELTQTIEKYIDKKDYFTITDINFIEDRLAVDGENKVKKFNNIKMELAMEVDSKEAPFKLNPDVTWLKKKRIFEESMHDMNLKFLEVLAQKNPIEYAKIGEVTIANMDSNYELEYDFNIGNLRDEETMIYLRNEKSKEEKILLEKTFEFVKEEKETYGLTRFGIEEDIFLIEFYLYKNLSGEKIREIAKMSNGLHNFILGDEDFQKYISSKNLKSIKMVFNRGEDDEDPIVYGYKVN